MNLIAAIWVLTILTSEGTINVGTADDDLRCAAGMGYISRNIELDGGNVASEFFLQEDGAYFSINYELEGSVVTLACAREDV